MIGIGIALALAAVSTASAQDWPQWRGPGRDGRVVGLAPREPWPKQLKLGWKATVGLGHSAPVVAGGRVFAFAREAEDEVVSAFDLQSGKRLWRVSYPAPYRVNPAAFAHGPGPKSTPAVANGRVYTLGIGGVLSCLDSTSGRVLWRSYFRGQFRETAPLYGAAMSPVVDGTLLIAHVGGPGDGALIGFDSVSGLVRWQWKGDGPGYASPVVAEIAGVRQVVTQTQGFLLGVSVADGALLWKLPFTTEYEQNAVTPIVRGDLVIYSGLGRGVRAARVVRRDDGSFVAAEAWANDEVSSYLSTPVLEGDTLYGLSHRRRGQFFALDAATGETRWVSEGRQGESAAVVAAPGRLFLLTTEGLLTVARAEPKAFAPLQTWTVSASATWAHPVVLPTAVLVKDTETLALWRFH